MPAIPVDFSQLSEPYDFVIVSKEGQVASPRGGRPFDPATLRFQRYLDISRTVNGAHNNLETPIGYAERVWYDGTNVNARIRLLTEAEHAKPWLQGLRAGTQRAVSIEFDDIPSAPELLQISLVGRGQDRLAVRMRAGEKSCTIINPNALKGGAMDWDKLRSALVAGIECLRGAAYETEEDRQAAIGKLFDGMKAAYEGDPEDAAALAKVRAAYAEVGVTAEGDTLDALHRSAMGDFCKGIQSLEALEVKAEHFIADRKRAADNRKQGNDALKQPSTEAWDTFAHVALKNNRGAQ